MGRRGVFAQRLVIAALVLFLAVHAVWGHLLPFAIAGVLRQAAGQTVAIGQVRVDLPLRLGLSDVSLLTAPPGTAARSRRIVLIPAWLSWSKKTVWVRRLKIEGLAMQCQRTWNGRFEFPLAPSAEAGQSLAPPEDLAPFAPDAASASPEPQPPSWKVVIETVEVVDGTVEFLDEKTAQPFRASLTELSVVGGPIALPAGSARLSLAIQGRFVGHRGHAAAVYCSGWANLEAKNLEVSCRLEPLPLAAFEPYYQTGPIQVRVYDATLKATAHLSAKANDLEGRVQLEIGNLSEADLSFLGKTITDIKKLAGGTDRSLTGELQMLGPLDRPAAWRFQFAPGNEIVQNLLKPLFSRGIENVRIKVGQQTIHLGLTPASEAVTSSIEAASKTVQETLKILTPSAQAQGLVEEPAASPSEPAPSPAP